MIDVRKLARRLGVALNLRDPPNVPPYGWSYFDHLVAVYVTLNAADARADAVIKKSRERPDDLTWGDIFLLENTTFTLQPPEVVQRSAWILRERFREIASPSFYDKYVNSNVPTDNTPANPPLLKADLTRVLDVLHWCYSLIPMRERMRKSLTLNCLLLVVTYTALLGWFLVWCHSRTFDFLSMLACIVYAGLIGGFVSSQRRMQGLPNEGDPLISVFGLDNAGYYLLLSPLLGAIFAVILSLMFVGGILKGSIFPEFAPVSDVGAQGLSFFHFTWYTLPKNSEEYGKLFLWAFIAGFAERLVPDSLDRLASKLEPDDPSSSPKPAPDPSGQPPPRVDAEATEPKPKIAPETLQDVLHSGEPPAAGPSTGSQTP